MQLKQLKSVKDALAKVSTEATFANSNGTDGRTYLVHYWDYEEVYDQAKGALELERARAHLAGNSKLIMEINAKIVALPKPKINMVFKLMEPISTLWGTKVSVDSAGKQYRPVAKNVSYIYIPEDAVEMELADYEETTDKDVDKHGNEAMIIKLTIRKGILDVKEASVNWKNEVTRNERVYLTAVSFRSLQIAGKILYNETRTKRNLYGMEEIG